MGKGWAKGAVASALLPIGFCVAVPSSASWLTALVRAKNTPPKVVAVAATPSGISVRFSEKVRASGRSFSLACRPVQHGSLMLSASPAQTFTLRAGETPLRVGALCTFTVRGALVHDLAHPPLALHGTFTSKLKVQAPLTPPKPRPAVTTTTRPGLVAPVTTPSAAPPVTTAPAPTTTTTTTTGGGGGGGGGGGNHAPTDIVLSAASVAENQPAGTSVGTLGAVDADAGATATFALDSTAACPGADNAFFSVTGATLQTSASFDFESRASYSVCVRATDNGGLTLDKQLTVSVLDVNDTPTGIGLSNASVPENEAAGTVVGALSSTDEDRPAQGFTYALVPGAGAADNASFAVVGNQLVTATTLDFEQRSSFTIRLRTTDSGSPQQSFEQPFVIAVTDVEEPPRTVDLIPASVAENSPPGTAVGTLTATDPDAGDSVRLSLDCAGADNGSFTLSGTTLKTAATFDYEAKAAYRICVRATDRAGLTLDKQLTVTVADVNERPTAVSLTSATVAENRQAGTVVGTLVATDPDRGSSFTFALSCAAPDNAAFAIDGSTLKTAAVFDYETKSSYQLCVRATDNGGLTLDEPFTVTVTDVNESPATLTLDHTAVDENQPSGTPVGALAATDPDHGSSVTFSLGCPGADNSFFAIEGSTLETAATFDFEARAAYQICVRATDNGGLTLDKAFTVTVNDVNEPPAGIALTPAGVPENRPAGTAVGTLGAADPDRGSSVTFSLACAGADNASFTIDGSTLRTAAPFDFETKAVYQICVRATDNGGLTLDKPLTVTVTDVNEAPGAATLGATSVDEHQPAGTTVGTLVATDPDAGDTVSFTLACPAADNASFKISGATLQTNASFDFQTKQAYSICVRTTDRGGLRTDQPFTITVNPTGTSPCSISQPIQCEAAGGTFITFTNVTKPQGQTSFVFQCTGSLITYRDSRATITGSGWPVHLTLAYDPGTYDYRAGRPVTTGSLADLSGIGLSDGCTGDGNPDTIDLVVHIAGDGRTYGIEGDALKLMGSTGPSNIQITTGGGEIDCGPRESSDGTLAKHQDGVQIQNGHDIGFYGVTIGDWDDQLATCWGAGGAFFVSSANGHAGQNITVEDMRAITCNHGLSGDAGNGNATSGSVSDSVFRTGRPSDRTDVLATIDPVTGRNTVGLCAFASSPVSANVLALPQWSFDDVVPDAWSDAGQPWSPGFNPAYDNGA